MSSGGTIAAFRPGVGEHLLVAYARSFPLQTGKLRAVNALWRGVAGSDPRRVARLRYGGFEMACDLREALQRQYYFFGDYFLERSILAAWSAAARRATTVFDVGANAGVYSLAALAAQPTVNVQAFEPTPEIAERLRDTAARNRLVGSRVRQEAVLSLDGDAFLRRCGEAEGGNDGMNFIVGEATEEGDEQVVCVRLDSVVSQLGLSRVDLIKLDVQGAEADALEGAGELLDRGAVGTVFMELNWFPQRGEACPATRSVRRLEAAGYRFADPTRRQPAWRPAGDWLHGCTDIACRQVGAGDVVEPRW